MRILGVIPSRYASTRFPGKPLIDLGGKSMIQRVYEQAKKCDHLEAVVVATDDQRIFDEVQSFEGEVMLTSSNHNNGTERCQEVFETIQKEYDYVINIQGDEPFIDPNQINALCGILDGETQLGTLIKKIDDPDLLTNPNVMKVVKKVNGEALYFSRQAIPFVRSAERADWLSVHQYYKHIGIYAYRSDILDEIVKLPMSSLEKAESLEQLRWLENGYKIKLAETNIETFGIDTQEDYAKAIDYLKANQA